LSALLAGLLPARPRLVWSAGLAGLGRGTAPRAGRA
jgi:hypothetical protein